MNNSKFKNYFFVAIAATSLALASCTSARELSYQSTGSIPPYSTPEVDDKVFKTTEAEPQADFSTQLSTAADNSNESEITTGALMLPSDLDNNTTEIEPLITEANNDDEVELLFEDNEPVKKLQEERTHTEEIAQENPAPAQTAEVLRTAAPLMKPSNTPERSEPQKPIQEKTITKTEIQTNSTANLNRSPIAKPTVKTATNPENEHFTVIITTDGVGINSESILSQLEDAIASIQRGDHKDIVIDATQKQAVNQRIAEPVENEDSDEFDNDLVELLENEINKDNSTNTPSNRTKTSLPPIPHREVLTLAIGGGKSVVIDEGLLIDWENAIADEILGDPNDTVMPKWLLQGIEWITHASKEEPVRSQTIMPIYRHMEDSGILDDVDQSRMTPNQVVDKLRVFVDNAKATR